MTERAQQLDVGVNTPIDDVVRSASLKYCRDQDWLESMIELEFIPGAADYETLTDESLRAYMDSKSKESREVATVESIEKVVESDLRTGMTDTYARSRIKNLFVIRPNMLQKRIKSDMRVAHAHSRKDFKAFHEHAIRLADAFQFVDNGKPTFADIDTKRFPQPYKKGSLGSAGSASKRKTDTAMVQE